MVLLTWEGLSLATYIRSDSKTCTLSAISVYISMFCIGGQVMGSKPPDSTIPHCVHQSRSVNVLHWVAGVVTPNLGRVDPTLHW